MTKHPDGRYVDDAPFDPEAAHAQLERAIWTRPTGFWSGASSKPINWG